MGGIILEYSLDLAARCDGIVQLGRSPGSDSEVDFVHEAGGQVYASIDDLPRTNL